MTVFDFATILERTERRVRDDLLGAGPKTVDELRSIAGRLRIRYQTQLERRIQRAEQRQQTLDGSGNRDTTGGPPPQIKEVLDKAGGAAGAVAGAAGAFAGGLFAKMREGAAMAGSINGNMMRKKEEAPAGESPTLVDLPPPPSASDTTIEPTPTETLDDLLKDADETLNNFSIGDDDEDNLL